MARHLPVAAFFVVLALSANAFANGTADITLGNYNLLPNTPNQMIPIYVSGGAQVSAVNFNLQIADGGPAAGGTTPGPVFTGIDFVDGTIFQSDHETPLDLGSFPQVLTWDIVTANGYVAANGLLATVTVDTTGYGNGDVFPFDVKMTRNGATNFVYDGVTPVSSTLLDGMITIVPEPSTFVLLAAAGAVLCGLQHSKLSSSRPAARAFSTATAS